MSSKTFGQYIRNAKTLYESALEAVYSILALPSRASCGLAILFPVNIYTNVSPYASSRPRLVVTGSSTTVAFISD